MGVVGAQAQITKEVTAWQGVQALPHRFGGTEYRLGEKREIGHIHGDHMVDIPFPTTVRKELVQAGKAQLHHLLPDSGWISFYIRQPEDVMAAVELFKLSYDIAQQQFAARNQEN
jgi:Family of unknown function (DUF5519)